MTVRLQTASDLVTVIVTTSVTPSAPSTELLSSVFESFSRHCPSLAGCRVIVVFDGYDQIVPKARLKKGCVTPEQATHFDLYKDNVKEIILNQKYSDNDEVIFDRSEAEAEYGSPSVAQNVVAYSITQTRDKAVTFIEPERRLGFGLAVRSALRVTETPYVWVQQHDWSLVSDFPLDHLLQVMKASEANAEVPIKYVCLPAVRMLAYAKSSDVTRFPLLKELTSSLKGEFSPPSRPDIKIPLAPLFFWHDKPHVASTAHYLASVFPTRLAVLRGDFIEDKIGQRARGQMKEGFWAKWASWIYYPDEGKRLCLRHLRGRTWEGKAKEADKVIMWRQRQEALNGPPLNIVGEQAFAPSSPRGDLETDSTLISSDP